jgi:hypothetical protein
MQHDFIGFGVSNEWRYWVLAGVCRMYHHFFPDTWLCYEECLSGSYGERTLLRCASVSPVVERSSP